MTDRRLLLKLAAAAAGTQWLARSAWSQPRIGHHPFTLGLASGSPQSDSVVLWTRLMPPPGVPAAAAFGSGPLTVRWELALDEQFRRIVRQGQALALPELAHSVHVEVDGLAPDTCYFYCFLYGPAGQDWVSTPGRTRTLPAPDAPMQTLRLAYASCQRWEHGHYSAYRHLLADAPDLVVFLGDYIYEYPNALDAVRRPDAGWVRTLADYRQRCALHKSDANLQAMHAACPWLVVWDDHEVQNDYVGMSAGDSGPTVIDFAARRAAACPEVGAAAWRAANPHFVSADTAQRGCGLADFTRARLRTTLRVVDDVTQPEAGIETLAIFEVAAGRSVIERGKWRRVDGRTPGHNPCEGWCRAVG